MASPLEALTGFALITAALTWFTQVYPPLSRRRALALELKGLSDSAYADKIGEIEPVTACRVLDTLASEVGAVRVDFTQHTEGFYFLEPDPDLSLAHQLSHALRLCDAAGDADHSAVRVSARRLSLALEQLAAKLDEDFVRSGGEPQKVFADYAKAHDLTSHS